MNEQHKTSAESGDRDASTRRCRRLAKTAAQSPLGQPPDTVALQRQVELAGDALLAGLTREAVLAALIGRIARDEHYLAYRKACHRRTSYDTQVEADLRALALAVCWLEEATPPPQLSKAPNAAPPSERPLTTGN